MLSAKDALRTTIVTCAAYFARWSAAWPAELPPPTMKTLSPARAGASAMAAP